MTYQIFTSAGDLLCTIPDNTVDHTTSLTLIGQNFLGYGAIFNDNFVKLLENGASTIAPSNPLVGQLWFNPAVAGGLNVWNGTTWNVLYTNTVADVLGYTGSITLQNLSDGGLALSASPTFTGTPLAPTAVTGTNTTQIATTAFVNNTLTTLGVVSVVGKYGVVKLADLTAGGVAALASPVFTGVPTAPTAGATTSAQIATIDFVTAALASTSPSTAWIAPLASPALTNIPTAPTASLNTASTQIATTAFVANTLAATLSGVPNLLLNPKLTVQQMNAPSISVLNTNYLNDGWSMNCAGVPSMTGQTVVLSDADRASIGDESAQYALSVSTSGIPSGNDFALVQQCLENNHLFSGKTVSISFWAYARGATTSPKLCIEFLQNFGMGGSPSGNVGGIGQVQGTVTLTSTWKYYTITGVIIPSVIGKSFGSMPNTDYLAMRFWLTAGNTIGAQIANNIGSQAYTVYLWNPQLQLAATPTVAPSRPYQDELALCMRYYETSGFAFGGYNALGGTSCTTIPYKVQKRVVPHLSLTGVTATSCTVSVFPSPNNLNNVQIAATNTIAGSAAPFSSSGTWIADARL